MSDDDELADTTPKKHHFIPSFYLAKWAKNHGQLHQYAKPHQKVIVNRKHPNATGFRPFLYTPQTELNFFKPVDDRAAVAMPKVEDNSIEFSDVKRRSDWSRFLMSLMLRTPEDIAILLKNFPDFFRSISPEIANEFRGRDAQLQIFQNHLNSLPPEFLDALAQQILTQIIDNEAIGSTINLMEWKTFELIDPDIDLLTSDRCILMSPQLTGEGAHIALPISPHQLFVASSDPKIFSLIKGNRRRQIIKGINRAIVKPAASYVFAANEKQTNFIAKNMSTSKSERHLERIFRR